MSNLEIAPQLDLRRVAETAFVCCVLGAAGAVLWQIPCVRKFATSVSVKRVLVDSFTGLVLGEERGYSRIPLA